MDWGQALRILNNARVSRAHEALAALLSGGNSRHLIPIQNGFGLDFVSPGLLNNLVDDYYDEEEDDYYYDDEEEEEDYFFSDRTWKESPPTPLVPHPRIKQLTTEEEEKRAADLVREEERRKEKIEKKRQKRMRQKENRRLGRLNAEKDNGLPNDKEQEQQPTASSEDPTASSEDPTASSEDLAENMDTHFIRETETDQPLVDEPDPIPTETEDTLPEEGNGDSVVVEEEEFSRESEELDMNSSFISTTAAIVKKRSDQKRERKDKRRKKKNQPHKPEVQDYQNSEVQNPEVREDEVQQDEVQEDEVQVDEVQVDERPEVLEYQNPEVQEVQAPQQENICNEDSVQRSTELANIGNLYAGRGQLDVAVQYFTDAIKHNPTEYKLFGNRSFCYEKMQQYDCALADADLALSMEPGWTKGLFRKGKALCGLKRYYEASVTYEEVLKQDGSREDASQELLRVRVMQLMEMGFSWERSLEALNTHRTFEEALEALSGIEGASAGPVPARSPEEEEEEEEWIEVGPPPTNQNTARIVPRAPIAAPTRPKPNTRGLLSSIKPAVWVGSVVPAITEARLHTLFSRAGEVHSVKMLEQQCAFVHYTRQEDCDTAIQLLNGFVEEGACLVVRHPTTRTHPAQVKKNWQHECYFWRTTGHCCKRDCAYIHISEHKGIDKAKTAHQ